MLKNAYIIRIISKEGEVLFSRPQEAYINVSEEGVNLEVYYSEISSNKYCIDKDFYSNSGISINKLKQFGLCFSLVNDGERSFSSWGGAP